MEERNQTPTHRIMLNDRRTGCFLGILDVLSFDINEVLLETEMGMLHIKGKDLHVNRLNLEKGEADIEGEIDSMIYSEIPVPSAKREGLFGKMFH